MYNIQVNGPEKYHKFCMLSGESGYCFVHQVNGVMVQDYRHPGPVYGCDWRDANFLATGCEDGRIRVFDVSKQKKEPFVELKGYFFF